LSREFWPERAKERRRYLVFPYAVKRRTAFANQATALGKSGNGIGALAQILYLATLANG
jgi:hypothetical protein